MWLFSQRRCARRGVARTCITAFMTTLFASLTAPVQAESLRFADALARAQQTPLLRASEAQIDAAKQAAIPAGELPDPKLIVGVDNVPIDGPDRYRLDADVMTMQRIGLMQEFPNGAKREARIDAATARVALQHAMAQLTRQTVLRETAQAWLARHTVERQLQRLDALLAENALFADAVTAQLQAGNGMAADAVMPRQEAVMLANRRDELTAQREQAIAQLRRWIGQAADAPLAGELPAWPLAPEHLRKRLHEHPELALYLPRQRVLDAEIAEASAATRPDWALEFAYQRRAPDFGDMVMLQVRVDLPFFASTRQQPLIAAKQSEQRALAAEQEASLREHLAMLETELADYARLQQTEARFTQQLLPLADEKVTLVMAAWSSGKGGLTDVIAARRERLETQLTAIRIEGQRLQRAAQLHFRYADSAFTQPGDDDIASDTNNHNLYITNNNTQINTLKGVQP